MIRKYLMMGIKLIIAAVPKSVRKQGKRSPWLTSLYSRNLQKSGLSYGIPTKKKTAKLYASLIVMQNKQLAGLAESDSSFSLVILAENPDLLDFTLKQVVDRQDIKEIIIVSDLISFSSVAHKNTGSSISFCKQLPLDISLESVFVINAGDLLHESLNTVLATFSSSVAQLGFVDSDFCSKGFKRHSPKLHAQWDPDLQLSSGNINTGLWIRNSDVFKKTLPLLHGKTGVADFLVALSVEYDELIIDHAPFVMVHTLDNVQFESAPISDRAIKQFDKIAVLSNHPKLPLLRVEWKIQQTPLVSLIIPTKNSRKLVKMCIESILTKTTYKNYEILLIDNQSDEQESLDYFAELQSHPQISVLQYNQQFNYSAINNFAVNKAKGDVIGLINNDVEVIEPDWLTYMVGQVCRKNIGCVGAKLLYPDGRIQHAGVVMGYGGGAGHAHKYFPHEHSGYLNRLASSNRFSAVTAACLLVKKADYVRVGGLDEQNLEVAFNDVDFCLKVLDLGKSNLYCAEAVLYHHESVTRGFDDTYEKQARFEKELSYLQKKWFKYIKRDPAYSPNLTLKRENFSIKECP